MGTRAAVDASAAIVVDTDSQDHRRGGTARQRSGQSGGAGTGGGERPTPAGGGGHGRCRLRDGDTRRLADAGRLIARVLRPNRSDHFPKEVRAARGTLPRESGPLGNMAKYPAPVRGRGTGHTDGVLRECSRVKPLASTGSAGWWWSTGWRGWSLGIRQSRYFGRVKTRFQLYLAATVANLTLVAANASQHRRRFQRRQRTPVGVRSSLK